MVPIAVAGALCLAPLVTAQGPDEGPARAELLKIRQTLANVFTTDGAGRAVAEYDRIAGAHAGSPVAAEALYYAAETARLAGELDDAIERYHVVAAQYRRSPFAPRAIVDAAAVYVRRGDPVRAMMLLQEVRRDYAASAEAVRAIEGLTVLHRLYVRAPDRPAFIYQRAITGPGGRLRDVRDIGVPPGSEHIMVATRIGVQELDRAGAIVRTIDAPDPKAVVFDPAGHVVTVHDRGTLRAEGRPPLVLSTARNDGRLQPIDIDAAGTTSGGDMIVANRSQKTLVRFSADGRPRGEIAKAIGARRLAVDPSDELAALDTDAKAIVFLARDGRVLGRLTERGADYQFREPVDIAFDPFGHLYVLDRGRVLVFAPHGERLITTFSVEERAPGAFPNATALALDAAGRLYLYVERADAVQVYQ